MRFDAHVDGSFSCAGATIPARPPLNSSAGNAGHGVLVVTETVSGSTTFTSATFANTNVLRRALIFGFAPRYESRLSFTASASTGVPSVNFTPGRSLIVHWSYVALGVTDSAR